MDQPLTYIKELPSDEADVSEETAYDSYYTEYTTPDSLDCGSDNLLVTFDYGYSDSIEASRPEEWQPQKALLAPIEPVAVSGYAEQDEQGGDGDVAIWFGAAPSDGNAFKVHHVQHKQQQLLEASLQSLISYDVDDYGDQSEPEFERAPNPYPSMPDNEEVFYDSIEC